MSIENLILLLELSTAIITILFYKKYKSIAYTFFLIHVCLIFLVEVSGLILRKYHILNSELYNLYTFFEINLVAIIYYNLIKENTSKKSIKIIMLIFNIFYFSSFLVLELKTYSYILGSIFVSFFVILFLREFLNSDRIIKYKENIFFWITIGILIYYLGTIPFQTILATGLENRKLFYIPILLTSVTHLFFIYGLLCSKKEMKS